MSENRINSKGRPSRRQLYIFCVTFLAVFLVGMLMLPTNELVYRTRAVLSVESLNGEAIDAKAIQNHLISASSEVLSDENLNLTISQIQKKNDESAQLSSGDTESIRERIQIGIKEVDNEQQKLVAISFVGSGTADERALIDLISTGVAEKIQRDEMQMPSVDGLANLQFKIKLNLARKQGIENFRTMLLTQHFKRIQLALNPPENTQGESRNVQASTASVSNDFQTNPSWLAFSRRQAELKRLQKSLVEKASTEGYSTKINLAAIEEELRWVDSQMEMEPRYLPLVEKDQTASNPVRPNVRDSSPATNGPTVKVNNHFRRVSHQPHSATDSMQSFFGQGYLANIHGVFTELDLRSNEITRDQDTLVRNSRDSIYNVKIPVPKTRFRVAQTAKTSGQLNNSIDGVNLMWLVIIGVVVGGFLTLNADWKVDGKVFDSSEDVSRKLGVPVLGTIGKTKVDSMFMPNMIRHAVTISEFAIVGFAAVMLFVAVSNNELGSQMLSDPLNGVVNAIRSMIG